MKKLLTSLVLLLMVTPLMVYAANGNVPSSNAVTTTTTLPSEYGEGYIPKVVKFRNAKACHAHAVDVYNCCLYFLNHEFKKKEMNGAAYYISKWVEKSEDVRVIVSPELMPIFDDESLTVLGFAFMASSSIYALKNGIGNEKDQFAYAVVRLLDYYDHNKTALGINCRILNKYLSLYYKDPQEFFDKLSTEYDQYYYNMQLTQITKFI